MSLENPESDNKIFSIAPAEGQKSLLFTNDKKFEAMCDPCNFPYGSGTFDLERKQKLTYRKYFNQRLLDDFLEILIICLLLSILSNQNKYLMTITILYEDKSLASVMTCH